MLYAVCFLGALGVVEAVKRTNKVARDPPDTLKRLVVEMVCRVDVLSVDVKVDGGYVAVRVFYQRGFRVLVDFLLGERASGNVDFHEYHLLSVTIVYHYILRLSTGFCTISLYFFPDCSQ